VNTIFVIYGVDHAVMQKAALEVAVKRQFNAGTPVVN
jgi:hypothetical protein